VIFGRVPVGEAVGAVLAHSLRAGERVFKKGRVLAAADVESLRQAGHERVVCARLEPGDVGEDEAAARVARAVAGPHVGVAAAATGRANLHASATGLVEVDAAAVDRLNAVDEAVTLATLPPWSRVEDGHLVATAKIIPFAVAGATLERLPPARVAVRPFVARAAGLVLTRFADTPAVLLERAAATQRQRLERLGSTLAEVRVVDHDEEEVAAAIAALARAGRDPILVLGASAIVDRRDVVPAGLQRAGGRITHLGMPVDPGNLLLLGALGATPVVGVPGCARSLKPSGFDWVLERLLAGVALGAADLTRLGAGGLLDEPPSRPQPRAGASVATRPRVAALILAAGQSRRMGAQNKLLAPLDGAPLVTRAVDAALASRARPVVVVTGHEADAVRAALAGRDLVWAENPDAASGMASSLRAGLAALPASVDAVLVCLGDMPRVTAAHLDAIAAAYDPAGDATIVVPTHQRKRGHPVLFARRHFAEMAGLEGDVGARALIDAHADAVRLVPVDDSGVTLDVDTPEMLAALAATEEPCPP
jgi:molybdenum cofactor cytidylyltransferase